MAEEQRSRFQERMQARLNGDKSQSLTERELQNVDLFEKLVDNVIEILKKEIDAMREGDFETLTELFELKKECVTSLETKMPIIEEYLQSNSDGLDELREKIVSLKALIDENGVLIERMHAATGSIVREWEKLKDRHSLSGTYGKDGRKQSAHTRGRQKFDEKL